MMVPAWNFERSQPVTEKSRAEEDQSQPGHQSKANKPQTILKFCK
jgi:hypothetical protein